MLQTLGYWRAHSSEKELAGFERELEPLLKKAMGTRKNTRYGRSYHRGLLTTKYFVIACCVYEPEPEQPPAWSRNRRDLGLELVTMIADGAGYIAIKNMNQAYARVARILVQRGVLFEHDGMYCLSAESVMSQRSTNLMDRAWLTIVAQMTLPFLQQLVPNEARETMLQPTPLRHELAGWLVVHGQQALNPDVIEVLSDDDWKLLLALNSEPIDGWKVLKSFYSELEKVQIKDYYQEQVLSFRASLQSKMPEGLKRLICLGLLGIWVKNGEMLSASVVLCDEAKSLLSLALEQRQNELLNRVQEEWFVEPCDVTEPSPWFWEHEIWKLWVALHFLPLGLTQQDELRKNDLKKLALAVGQRDLGLLGILVQSMSVGHLISENSRKVTVNAVDWKAWGEAYRHQIYHILRQWNTRSNREKDVCWRLLGELPTEQWLDLDLVETWLKGMGMKDAALHALFVQYQMSALSHLNLKKRRIYFLPQFHDVIVNKPPVWHAPGWHGADQQARITGFITASGEIQLPPDCRHDILPKLAKFCTLSSVEQMVTLQLDEKALQRASMDKKELAEMRNLLESVQSPLPQSVAYLFDKHIKQKPVASVAATSMLIYLHDMSAMQRLQRAGFGLTQPFAKNPEIVLLDANSDAPAFMEACVKEGILLDALIPPVSWVSGMAKVKVWMESHESRKHRWLEISYQKTSATKAKQLYARVERDDYGYLEVRGTRQVKDNYSFLKTTVKLQSKHILRLRELSKDETALLGLDKL